jgi:hypothetical protein
VEYRINYKKYLLIVGSVLTLVLLALAWMIYDKSIYKPPPMDQTATEGSPAFSQTEKAELGYSPLTIMPGLSMYLAGKPKEKDDSIELYLSNPKHNSVWTLCEIFDSNGEKVAESGLIKQGFFIRDIKKIKEIPEDRKISIKIFCFEPYTYYSAAQTITFECCVVK